jgi:hypothetical protein
MPATWPFCSFTGTGVFSSTTWIDLQLPIPGVYRILRIFSKRTSGGSSTTLNNQVRDLDAAAATADGARVAFAEGAVSVVNAHVNAWGENGPLVETSASGLVNFGVVPNSGSDTFQWRVLLGYVGPLV